MSFQRPGPLEMVPGRDQVRATAEWSEKGQSGISAKETKGNQAEGHLIRSMRDASDPSSLVHVKHWSMGWRDHHASTTGHSERATAVSSTVKHCIKVTTQWCGDSRVNQSSYINKKVIPFWIVVRRIDRTNLKSNIGNLKFNHEDFSRNDPARSATEKCGDRRASFS